jgi:hypothetical protein
MNVKEEDKEELLESFLGDIICQNNMNSRSLTFQGN